MGNGRFINSNMIKPHNQLNLKKMFIVLKGVIGPGKKWNNLPVSNKNKPLQSNIHVNKGDLVVVIAGDDCGKVGQVLAVYPKTGRIRVKGVNIKSEIKTDGSKKTLMTNEGVIDHSNVMHWSKSKSSRSRV